MMNDFGQADQESAKHRARDAADAADDGGCEAFQPRDEAHEVVDSWKTSPTITPAAPASAEPMKKVETITRSTSIPIIAAASRSKAVARIALPSRVLRDKQRQQRSSAPPTSAITMIRTREMLSGPQWMPVERSMYS